jgi:hypothetical protein
VNSTPGGSLLPPGYFTLSSSIVASVRTIFEVRIVFYNLVERSLGAVSPLTLDLVLNSIESHSASKEVGTANLVLR